MVSFVVLPGDGELDVTLELLLALADCTCGLSTAMTHRASEGVYRGNEQITEQEY